MFSLPWNRQRKQDPSRRRRGPRLQVEVLEDRVQPSLVAASSTDQKINVTSPLDQTLPSVAMDANGDFVVAWSNQVHLGPNYLYDVDARVYNKAGQAQTGEIVVAQTTGDTRPSVAMDANGDFVVAWQVLNTTTYYYGISAQRYNLAGTPQGSTLTLNTGATKATTGTLPKVAMDATGDFTIAFQGYDSNSHGIFAQRFNSSGASQGAIFPVNTVTTGNQGAPTIAMDSAGDFTIAWQDGGQAQNAGIYAQRYNSSGVTQGGNTAISTVTSGSSPGDPSIAMEPTGQYAIAWQFPQTAAGAGHGFQGVETQRFDASGAALTGVVQLNTPENYDQGSPSVAIDSDGDFVVAWESYGQGGTAASINTIFAQRVNSAGTLIGTTQFTPSTQSGDNQRSPSVASDPNGDTMIVWESQPVSTSDSQNVYGRLYDHVNDAPTINTPSNVTINENAGQQTINLTGITAGGGETQTLTVTASSNNTALVNPSITYTSPNSTGTLTFTPAPSSFGTATVTVTVTDNGGTQNGGVDTTQVQFTVTVNQISASVSAVSVDWGTRSMAVQTAADGLRLLPAGRNTDMPWININAIAITLSQPETLSPSDVTATGITVANYGPVTISGSGTNYTITLAQAITSADRVTIAIGNAGISTFTRRLDVLPGDVSDDGVVTLADGVSIIQNYSPPNAYSPFRDLNGDGLVNVSDFTAFRPYLNTTLPNVLLAQLAAGGPGPGGFPQLTNAQLQPVLAEAIANWTASGIPAQDVALLHHVTAQIAPLPDDYLGGTALGGLTIYVSPDAAGYGWNTSAGNLGGEDLETVLVHELGHSLGLYDLNPAQVANDLMTETLAPGVSRLPSALDVAAVDAVYAAASNASQATPTSAGLPAEPGALAAAVFATQPTGTDWSLPTPRCDTPAPEAEALAAGATETVADPTNLAASIDLPRAGTGDEGATNNDMWPDVFGEGKA